MKDTLVGLFVMGAGFFVVITGAGLGFVVIAALAHWASRLQVGCP